MKHSPTTFAFLLYFVKKNGRNKLESLLKCNKIISEKNIGKAKRVNKKLSNIVNGEIMYIVPF